MTTEITVTDPRAVKVLLSEQAVTYLEPYLGTDRSIGEAAERIGRSVQRTHYWTRRMLDVGLVEVVHTSRRAGRPIHRYQAVADSFRISAQSLPVGLFESMLTTLNRALVRSFEAAYPDIAYGGDVLIRPAQNASGTILDRVAPDGSSDGPPDALQCSFTTRLSPDDAAQLRVELGELRDRWSAKTGHRASGQPLYLSVLALTPLPDDG